MARAFDVPRAEWGALRALLRRLDDDARAAERPAPSRHARDVVLGRLQGTRGGFAFIVPEHGPDVYVRAENQGTAIHGDLVEARLERVRGRQEGIVVRVVQQGRKLVSGMLRHDASGWFLVPDEARIARDVNLSPSAIQPRESQAGHKALVRIAGAGRDADLLGEVVTVLGAPDHPGVRTAALVAEFDLPETFPDEVLASVEEVRPPVPSDFTGREDLSASLAFTIDPLDAKDHDDAVSIARQAGGGFELGVHIADVSWYVLPDGLVDREAEHRATSVYLADRVVPMLPEILSNHVCSLRPGVPRLTLSAFATFDAEGRLRASRLSESWIASRVKLSYEAAESLLAGNEPQPGHLATLSSEESGEPAWSGARSWTEIRAAVGAALADMRHLARLLRARRMEGGSLDIETTELKVMHDARGRVVRIDERPDLESYSLIEEFMLVANQVVAQALARGGQPLLWRIHERPDTAKSEELRLFLKKLGLVWSPGDPPDHADYQRLLRAIDRRAERKHLMVKVLRSLQKAVYDPRPLGHFGLAFAQYTHFTSPIRRYPDLYNHRLIRRLLGRPARGDSDGARFAGALRDLGAHTSQREVVAADAERASLKLKLCEYLADRVGDEANGTISSIADHGLYVDVPEWKGEGLVHADRLTDDDWQPDPQRTRLVGRRTHRILRFGQEVRVRLVRSDPDRRQIDLDLVR